MDLKTYRKLTNHEKALARVRFWSYMAKKSYYIEHNVKRLEVRNFACDRFQRACSTLAISYVSHSDNELIMSTL